jgi:hypothetical protein
LPTRWEMSSRSAIWDTTRNTPSSPLINLKRAQEFLVAFYLIAQEVGVDAGFCGELLRRADGFDFFVVQHDPLKNSFE